MRVILFAAAVFAVAGCKKKPDGLPPAQDWSGGQIGEAQPQPPARDPHAGMGGHGGAMPPGHPPSGHGGAMPPGHPPTGADQLPPGHPPMDQMAPGHASGSPDVTQMGFAPPDPARKLDPNRKIQGVLKVTPAMKSKVKPGGAVFLIVKKADASGAPSGPPLAVDRVLFADNLKFELTEAHAMIANTELVGDVVVTARYDQDSDAISKQPGDVTGQVRVKVPATNVQLTLDTLIQ